eukprot:scaffold1395_cov397-Prasinococcus_capsulatus_cf.AAC.10
MTSDTESTVPVMLTILVAKTVADALAPVPFFDMLVVFKDIPYLDVLPSRQLVGFTAKDVMTTDLVVLQPTETVETIVDTLTRTPHNGFPISPFVDTSAGRHAPPVARHYVGFITRRKLLRIIKKKVLAMSPLIDQPSSHTLLIPRGLMQQKLNLHSACGKGMYSFIGMVIPPELPLYRVYRMFSSLGFRHLVVVSQDNELCGIITRHDIMKIENGGLKDMSMKQRAQRRRTLDRASTVGLVKHPFSGVTRGLHPCIANECLDGCGVQLLASTQLQQSKKRQHELQDMGLSHRRSSLILSDEGTPRAAHPDQEEV